jgi:hypothetical protein
VTTDELVATVSPQIGVLGAAFYFAPETLARGKELGLDGFRFYFLGRGGVLGDVEAPVVQSAFGYFEADLVTRIWESARAKASVPPRQVGRAFVEASQSFGRARFSDLAGLEGFCAAAGSIVEAAEPAGLALFAALAAEPLPEDLPGRAMQLVTVLREHRGSAHLLAVVASGVTPRVAHYFRRPNDFTTFGYPDDDVPVLTDDQRSNMATADTLTDEIVGKAFGVLDEDGREALVQGLQSMAATTA